MILNDSIYDPMIDFLGAVFGGLGLLTLIVGIRYFATSIPLMGLDEDLEENFGFAILSLALGTICFALAIFLSIAVVDFESPFNPFHWFSIVLASVMGVTLVARSIKEFPMTKTVAIGFIVLVVITAILFLDATEITLLGVDIPLWPIPAALAIVVGILVILTFFTEQSIDFFMGIIGHPVVQTVVAIIAITHGVALFLDDSKYTGLWHFVKEYLE
ncbi:MAG: hypothetical protein ACXAB4_03485 [Candidatus Hodarchaeales archaeon]|jgi:hypothetical protein